MSASGFLISLGQCLATMNLYAEGHPARERALDNSYERLRRLLEGQERFEVSFVNTETVVGDRALSDIGIWDWAPRLAGIGVERIEIDPGVTSDEYDPASDLDRSGVYRLNIGISSTGSAS